MASGYSPSGTRKLYVYPKVADGAVSGTAQSGWFASETNPTVAEVTALAVAANRLRGATAKSGGGETRNQTDFSEWGGEVTSLGAATASADISVTAGVRYDDSTTNGLAEVTELVVDNMALGASIAVITEHNATSLGKKVFRVHIGTVTAKGAISEDSPDTLTFGMRGNMYHRRQA